MLSKQSPSWARLVFAGCSFYALADGQTPIDASVRQALARIQPAGIRAHLEFLADDALEGRRTGTRGHELAARYVKAQFAALGLKSGVNDGTYFDRVNLRRTELIPSATTFAISRSTGKPIHLTCDKDFTVLDTHAATSATFSAPVVFAGYGVTAPEFGYDDYAGIDVAGKFVAVFFLQAPPSFPATERAHFMDPQVKQEIALAHGAVGLIYIDTPETLEKFPWTSILRALKIGFNSMRWMNSDAQPYGLDARMKVTAILNRSGSAALFAGESQSSEEVFAGASAGTPKPFAYT